MADGTQNVPGFGILYGRKWEIKIYKPAYKDDKKQERDPDNDIGIDVSELKCIFRCQYQMNTALTVGTLVVYNLSAETEAGIIKEGFQFSVSGGYENGQYGEIFVGDIIQVIRNREDGINYRLELLGVSAVMEFDWNWVRASVAAQAKPRDVIGTITEKAEQPLKMGEISEKISQQPLPRGKILFGKPYKYLRQIAEANNSWFALNSKREVTLTSMTDEIPENMCLSIAPESGLIGTPRYTDNGIIIKMLLDARVKLGSLIKIDNSIIQGQLINIDSTMSGKGGSNSQSANNQNAIFDESGEYMAIAVTHSLDTWGDEWSTEAVGMGRNGPTGLLTSMSTPEQTAQ